MPKVKQTRNVIATVYFAYVVMRWKILRAPMTASTMTDRPGSVWGRGGMTRVGGVDSGGGGGQ